LPTHPCRVRHTPSRCVADGDAGVANDVVHVIAKL
jgi:hypothetical protein